MTLLFQTVIPYSWCEALYLCQNKQVRILIEWALTDTTYVLVVLMKKSGLTNSLHKNYTANNRWQRYVKEQCYMWYSKKIEFPFMPWPYPASRAGHCIQESRATVAKQNLTTVTCTCWTKRNTSANLELDAFGK